MKELASGNRRSSVPRALDSIPAFRQHLARTGLSFEQWQARNRASCDDDVDSQILRLQHRKLQLKR
jgi:hypothetical protein